MSLQTEKEIRRATRIGLSIPARLDYKIDRNNSFNEIIRLNDVSPFGTGFILDHPVKRGRLVHLTIPMPRQLRSYDYMDPQYRVWAIVRHCIPVRQRDVETYSIGTAFIGKEAPASYQTDPCRIYEVTDSKAEGFYKIGESTGEAVDESTLHADMRRHSRYQIPLNVVLESVNEKGDILSSANSVTENVSLGGASLFTELDVNIGSFLRFNCEQYNVSIISVVRGKRTGNDGFPRLHIEFIDRYFPLEGVG